MDGIEFLREQHRHLERLLTRLEEAPRHDKGSAFTDLVQALSLHTFLEENTFLPGVRLPPLEEQVEDALEELDVLQGLLEDTEREGVRHQRFGAWLEALGEALAAHVRDQETLLFPRIREEVEPAAVEALGDELRATAAEWEEADRSTASEGWTPPHTFSPPGTRE